MNNMDDPWNFHQCKLCSYKTRYIHCILSHVRQHRTRSENHRFVCDLHSPENHQCEKCQFQSDLRVLLTEHVKTVHKTEETHYPSPVLRYCEKCGFQTYSSLVLLSRDNSCDGSGLPAKEKNSLELDGKGKNHAKRQRGKPPLNTNQENVRFLQCSYCCYKTKFNGCLKSHMLWKHTPSDKIRWFKCEDCSYKSKTKTNLRTHMLTKHIQPTEQVKPKCSDVSGNSIPVTSPSNSSLKAKLENGANNPSSGEQIKHSNLNRDRAPSHTNQKKDRFFQCGYCPYESKLSGNVKTHMLWKHTPSDQINFRYTSRKKNGFFRCNFCSHKTKRNGNLKTHMLWKHTPLDQINWCKCDLYCFYKCKDEFQLRQHVLAKHSAPTELEQFKCDQFPHKTNMRDHLR